MIQRIQSIYLLAASILAALFAYMPLLYFSTTEGDLFDIYMRGIAVGGELIHGVIYMVILGVAAALLPLITIFFYKRLMRQMRYAIVSAVLALGCYVMVGVYFFMGMAAFDQVGIATWGFRPTLFVLIAALILELLAARAIFRDEMLIRSVDRIR